MTKVDSIRVFMTKRQTALYTKSGFVPVSVRGLAKKLAAAANQGIDVMTEEGDYIESVYSEERLESVKDFIKYKYTKIMGPVAKGIGPLTPDMSTKMEAYQEIFDEVQRLIRQAKGE